jgi:hypothetical protein
MTRVRAWFSGLRGRDVVAQGNCGAPGPRAAALGAA